MAPTSWLVTRRGGAPVRRHALLAVVVGIVVAAVLAVPTDEPLAWWGLFAVFTVGIGAPVAALAAWAAQALPARWVHPVAIVGLIVAGLVLPVGTWLQLRPPAPHDFVVVHEPDLVRQHFGDAYDLAVTLAVRFEQHAAAGHPRTAHETWVSVGAELSDQELDGVASWIEFTPDDDLPTLAGSQRPVRLVTTIFESDDTRGCVVVTAHTSRAEPQACADLNLTN